MAADLDALEQLHRIENTKPKPKTFASRIRLASERGLISKGVFDDLEKLRDVRNLVAHSIKDISLVDVYDVVNSIGTMKRTASKRKRAAATVEKSAKGIRKHLLDIWINLWIEVATRS